MELQKYVSLYPSEGAEARPKIQKLFEACRKVDVKKWALRQKTSAARVVILIPNLMNEKTMLNKFLSQWAKTADDAGKHGRHSDESGKASSGAQTSVKRSRSRRAFLKRELAQAYFPSASGRSALQHLRRAIKGDPQLRGELARAGYKVRTHYFTLRQARILDFYFG